MNEQHPRSPYTGLPYDPQLLVKAPRTRKVPYGLLRYLLLFLVSPVIVGLLCGLTHSLLLAFGYLLGMAVAGIARLLSRMEETAHIRRVARKMVTDTTEQEEAR